MNLCYLVPNLIVVFINFIGRWHLGTQIGNTKSSFLETTICPQIGGEFVGAINTKRFPVFGIESWVDCSYICSSQDDCQHWQWMSDTKVCYSVKSFSEFRYNRDVTAGARNCPINSQSLFNLCPTRGDDSYMWRKTTPGDSAFYDPGIVLSNN